MESILRINRNSKLADLLAVHPPLREILPEINGRFRLLNTPLAAVMLRKATIAEMSRRSGMEESVLIRAIQDAVGVES